MVGRTLLLVAHGGKTSSTWRAVKWLACGAILGQLMVELGIGPKTKFDALGLLYNFY
jgi:hypothetical protein